MIKVRYGKHRGYRQNGTESFGWRKCQLVGIIGQFNAVGGQLGYKCCGGVAVTMWPAGEDWRG